MKTRPSVRRFLLLAAVASSGLVGVGHSSAQVVISEIHYHPVEEAAFDSTSTFNPTLDLTDDVHEFVEIQNAGSAAVDLGNWTLGGDIDYTFPSGTSIAAGAYKVIAKNPTRLQTVYSITGVLGAYTGKLSNGDGSVKLKDSGGATIDAVNYSSSFPWAQSANALGEGYRFTGIWEATYQYKGRSLQRVSVTGGSNDPANWLASPLSPGPTPGSAQAVTRTTPKPVVVSISRYQTSDNSTVIGPSAAVTVKCSFSSTSSLTNVTLEWFVYDVVNASSGTHTSTVMTDLGNGDYSASITGQSARAVVRYRIKANRGDGLENVSPRADDPSLTAIGTSNTLEAWHGYFVNPTGRSTTYPNYDVLIYTTNWNQLVTNANANPPRVTATTAAGIPREYPLVTAQPYWDGSLPAVFAYNGELFDIQIRFHGSKYHRSGYAVTSATANSFKVYFPENHLFRNKSSWYLTPHGQVFHEATKLNRLLGLPASQTRFITFYLNSYTSGTKLEQGEYDGDMLKDYHQMRHNAGLDATKEEVGELYKDVGNRDASQNNLEGPYTCGDFAPPVANANWTKYQRSQWTFQLQNNTWKGPKPFGDMIDAMWTMRGDSASHNGTSLSGNATNLANTKAWFLANYDMDQTLTSMALLEWLSIWDDAKQNQFYWRKASGKWMRLGWDYDGVMSTGGGGGGMGGGYTQSITGGEYGSTIFDGVNWWKDTFYKCFLTEYKQKLWKLNNSTLDKANLVALGFTTSSSCYTFANVRQANVNTQLALGTYYKPVTPTNSSPSSGGVVLSGASLATSAYSHPNGKAHTSTTWVIRSSAGNYEEPVFATTSTTNLTSLPIPYDHLTYGQTYYWHAMHTDADGHDSILSTETSFTWGTAATVAAGNLALNEILASNKNAATNGISHPDYVELVNNTASAISLTGVTLTNDVSVPGKYVFPSGNTIAAGAHLIVWCDTSATDPGLHSGFNLSAGGDTVLLMNGSTILDTVTFGPQAPDLSIGRIANGTGTWTATTPTPGATNSAATLGTTATLSVNEWMADPAYGDDWFELYNSGTNPVALAGLYLSDTPSTPAVTQIPVLSFIAAGGYTRFWADGSSDGGNHCNFKLSKSGESVVLTASNGTTTINKYTFGSQTTDVSQGRFPDGSSTIGTFAATASSEKPNWLASAVVINEALTHPADGSTAWIELRNTGASAANISYWWLSNDFNAPKKYQFPNGTSIPAGGYLVVEAATFGSAFTLDSTGGEICLSEGPSGGTLTGYRSQVKYGVAEAGVSFGRVECTGHNNGDNNTDFWPMQAATSGAVNSDPLTSPLQINEVMYHPTDGSGGADVTTTEFIEIHNRSNAAVTAAGWKLKGDVDFTFPSGTTLAPDGYLVVVGFNPSTDPTSLANFRTTYGLGAEAVIVGPFSTNLPNSTADLELAETVDYSGVLYYANVDKVEYRDLSPWPTLADGGGQSLQRASRSLIGNTASNWSGATPTPAALNAGLYTTLAIWTESPLPGATAFTSYSAQLVGVGGTTPYSWSLASGSLPGGLTLDSSGLIHGIPLSTGLVSFTVRITDHLAATTTLAMTINVTSSATDSDADGMPDAWESYYGMVNGINDAAIDSDADGQTNLAEYLAGTNPVSRTSVFRITSLTAPAGGHVTLAWSGVAGKTYRISSSPDLETWTDLGSTVTCSTTGTVSADVSVTGERRFLRVTVVP